MDKGKTPNFLTKWYSFIFTAPVFILVIWELFSRLNLIGNIYFPAPSKILFRFLHLLFKNPEFLGDVLHSLRRLAFGTMISVPLAIIVGVVIGLSRKAASFISPLISITYPIPKLSILPLLMILFGIGDASKIAVIAIGIFYLVLLSVVHGIKGLPAVYFDIIFIYKIPLMRKIFSLILKGILPDILSGCKIGIGYGLVMVVASEFIAAKNGIGFFMWNAWDQFRINDLYVGLVVFSLMGLAIFFIFDWLMSKLKWKYKDYLY